jgi:hypothetical protein
MTVYSYLSGNLASIDKTLKKLSKKTRVALGKQAAKVVRARRRRAR